MEPLPFELAEVAYEAYGESTGNKNSRGEPMPTWADLPDAIQVAWAMAAGAVRKTLLTPPSERL